MSAVGGRKRILILEDDEDVSTLLAMALEDAGYEPVVHEDGADVDALASAPPSVIILDMVMPRARMDGFAFLAGLAEQPAAFHIPLIILSGLGDEFERAVDSRMVARLTIAGRFAKPFSIDEVLARIAELTAPPA